jgi:uncharacterized membrane protein YcjF (UPF0283 family)
VLAAVPWHYWLAVVLLVVAVLTELGVLVGYHFKVHRLELAVEHWKEEHRQAIAAAQSPER